MTNMKMDKEEAAEYSGPSMAMDAPEYPYGLKLDLDDSSMEKLGMDKLPEVGSSMMIRARVEVCSSSEYKTQGGESEKRVCLQITDMEAGPDMASKDKAQELYG